MNKILKGALVKIIEKATLPVLPSLVLTEEGIVSSTNCSSTSLVNDPQTSMFINNSVSLDRE